MSQIPDKPTAAEEAFDPYHLRPLASLNRRQFISLPGIDPELAGKTGWELLSRQAFIQLIQGQAPKLGLETIAPPDLPLHLNALLASPAGSRRAIAETIADQYGRRLGYLIASIILSPHGLTAPLVPWEEAYLKHWQEEVQEIILGGGLASGQFGQRLGPAVERALDQCGLPGRRVEAAAYPAYLPLIGAARSIGPDAPGPVIVVDFGGTQAKRGVAFFDEAQALHKLRVLPSQSLETLMEPGQTAELAAAMVRIIVETINAAGSTITPHILCSVAAYVQDGQPMNINRGAYTWLNHILPNITGWFSQQISAMNGTPVEIEFGHDCDTAARAYAGQSKAAVLMLGSALGVGFVPPVGGYRPISDHFRLDLV